MESCLNSIISQSVPLQDITLTIIDNGSKDNTAAIIHSFIDTHQQQFADVVYIASEHNHGFGKAHNQAIARHDNAFILLLNPDARLKENSLALLLKAALQDSDEVAAWEPRQVPYEHPKTYHPATLETDWCSGAALLLRRSAFEHIGGFEPLLFLYCEDVDLSWRLRAAGYTLRYIPSAVVFHDTYQDPYTTKHSQWIGNIRGNLFLRLRFGDRKAVRQGIAMQWGIFKKTGWHIKGVMLRWWLKLLWKRPQIKEYAGKKQPIKATIHGWDYGERYAAKEYHYHNSADGVDLIHYPVVSVLIRTMGTRNPLLKEAVASVCNQTYPHEKLEIVVVQDGEATLGSVCDALDTGNIPLRYAALGEKQGRSAAGNKAVALASGEYCVFLDDDDMLLADHIEQLMAAIQSAQAAVAFGYGYEVPSVYAVDGASVVKEEQGFVRFDVKEFSYMGLLTDNYLPINSVLFRKQAFEDVGGFDTDFDFLEDWDLWLRMAHQFRPFAFLPKVCCMYRVPASDTIQHERGLLFLAARDGVVKKHESFTLKLRYSELVAFAESKAA